MASEMESKVRKVYDFLSQTYSLNWTFRWDKTPFMESFASKDDIKSFLQEKGRFETVSGHVWGCILMWSNFRKIALDLDRAVDSSKIYERLAMHDIGESLTDDNPLSTKIDNNLLDGKDEEKKGYLQLVELLPVEVQSIYSKWFDEFDGESDYVSLEVLVCRWIDNLQGDQFALCFGSNFSENSELIGKIIKKRSIYRAKVLIDKLEGEGRKEAAEEIRQISQAHISIIREKGIEVDLTEFGF